MDLLQTKPREIQSLDHIQLTESIQKLQDMPISEISYEELLAVAYALDQSNLNRTNVLFNTLSILFAEFILTTFANVPVEDLENLYAEVAVKPNSEAPFSLKEGIKFAINKIKVNLLDQPSHIDCVVPYFKEFERAAHYSEENPNGEATGIQKIQQLVFLLKYNALVTSRLIFVNDAVAEKKDLNDNGESSTDLMINSVINWLQENGLEFTVVEKDTTTEIVLAHPNITIIFTGIEAELAKRPEERERFENRGEDGKLRERKGGAVLAGLEIELPENLNLDHTVRLFTDADSHIPLSSFLGEAAYEIIVNGHGAYLPNLKHKQTVISTKSIEQSGTDIKVQRRKTFFSGFLVPALFPDLVDKHGYLGTTQLPAKAFSGHIDFGSRRLTTMQPNVDLGLITESLRFCNIADRRIASGSVTVRDNIDSSTMTTSDLESEWRNTYGPIFKSAAKIHAEMMEDSDMAWLLNFVNSMDHTVYEKLFTHETTELEELFQLMASYKSAEDKTAVLKAIGELLERI